jgi:glycosyltransferase involved in cell wall biosynthesis
VPHLLAAFDCALLPGCTDIICPIKVSEYMAAGLPVVIPNHEPNREIISPGENGLLFTPQDARSLSEEMLNLKNNPGLRDRMGSRARKTAAENLTWEETWGRVVNLVTGSL